MCIVLTAKVNTPETSLLVTEPYFNLPNIAETYDQMVFEEWEFQSYYRCTRKLSSSPITRADPKLPPWRHTVVYSPTTTISLLHAV